jgi:hypothetical protein
MRNLFRKLRLPRKLRVTFPGKWFLALTIGVRPHIPSDPVRDMHWKVSARLGKWMVKEREVDPVRAVDLLLPVPSPPREFELLVSRVCALLLRCERDRVPYRLRVGPGLHRFHGSRTTKKGVFGPRKSPGGRLPSPGEEQGGQVMQPGGRRILGRGVPVPEPEIHRHSFRGITPGSSGENPCPPLRGRPIPLPVSPRTLWAVSPPCGGVGRGRKTRGLAPAKALPPRNPIG